MLPRLPSSAHTRTPAPLVTTMLALQALGVLAMLTVWVLETREGVITPWDRWLLPLAAAIVGCSTVATLWRPALEPRLRSVPVGTFNLYLVVALQAAVTWLTGEEQRYQMLTVLYWMPLGYGCAFVFLNLRAALLVSGLTAAGVFAPLLHMVAAGTLPAWLTAHGPLLPQMALAHGLFVVLLTTVVRLRHSNDRARAHAEVMRELAETDTLTSLPNRRAMTERLEAALALSRRIAQPLVVALVDVDRFKSINDRFGHAAGDAVLQQLGQVMRRQLRASDALGRWGGEEFLLFAPATAALPATELAERVRRAVAAHAFPHGEPVTVSIGLVEYRAGDDFAALLQRADRALYAAKERGRNRVEAAACDEEPVPA